MLFCLSNATPVIAVDNLTLQFDAITGVGWQVNGVVIHLQIRTSKKLTLTGAVATLQWTLLKRPIKHLEFQCAEAHYTVAEISCLHATLNSKDDLFKNQKIKISFTYNTAQQRIHFNLHPLSLAGGQIEISVQSMTSGWWLKLQVKHLDTHELLTQLGLFIDIPLNLTLGGKVTLTAEVAGTTQVQKAQITCQVNELNLSNPEGTQTVAGLIGETVITLRETSEGWHGKMILTVDKGEIYSEPFYLGIEPLQQVATTVELTWQKSHLKIHYFSYDHREVLKIHGFGEILTGETKEKFAVKQLILQLEQTPVAKIYTHYAESLISSKALANLNINGTLAARLEWDTENHYWAVNLHEINVEQNLFGLKNLNGTVQWHNHLTDLPTYLRWDKAHLSALNFGKSELLANFTADRLNLLQPLSQPVLGGELRLNQFALAGLGEKNLRFEFNGELKAISLQQLTKNLDLPTLDSQLSGKIPSLRYEDARLTLTEALQLQVFGGQVVIKKLQIDDLFGQIPVLLTDMEAIKLNLQTLTKIAGFGEIQGHLSGYIHDLQLVNWKPMSFDARFFTPEDNTLPRKISQRAIDTLSSLNGGGPVNALSRRFLRLFEDFSYQRLGWGCKLKNGVCQMQGIGKADKGYYIVKGGGIPHISVIGYNQRVDWNVLIERLKNVAHAKEPIIK